MRVLGLDPGYRSFGVTVAQILPSGITYDRIDVWHTKPDKGAAKKGDDNQRRLRVIAHQLWELFNEVGPAIVFTEAPMMGGSNGFQMKTSVMINMGRVRGLVDAIAEYHGIDVLEVAPQTLKASITGDKSATKHAMAMRLDALYPGVIELLPHAPRGGLIMNDVEHAADSALTIHALREHPRVVELLATLHP